MFDRAPIRTQLLVLVLSVALPAAVLITYAVRDRLIEARQGAERQLLVLAQDAAGRIDVLLQRRAELMARLAERPQVRALDPQKCVEELDGVVAVQAEFRSLSLHRRDGELLCSVGPFALSTDETRPHTWFREALASGKPSVGGAYQAPGETDWATLLTQPVRPEAGPGLGILTLSIDLQTLQRQVMPDLPTNAIVVVFDRELRYLMRTADPARWLGQPLPDLQRAQLPEYIGSGFELTGVDGVRRLNVGARVPASGWLVYVALPVEEIDAGFRRLLWRSLALSAFTLVGAGLLAWRIGSRIARPLDALATSAAALASGRLAMTTSTGSSEVVAVAADLSRLSDERSQLRSRHARLSASYDQLASATRDIVLLIDPHGRIVEANAAAMVTYGYSVDELCAMTITELRAPEARGKTERDFRAAARTEGVLFETLHQRKDGSTLPVEVSSRLVEIDGQAFRQSFIRDISGRKRDEALLRGQSAVLAQVAEGAPLKESLSALARLIEAQSPGVVATILLLDPDGLHLRHGAAPSLSKAFLEAIDGAAIGPNAGACGAAAYRREPVTSEDIATDPLWDDWRALATAHGLRACWSTPILNAGGKVLGSFALYFREPGKPSASHQQLVDLATHTAAIAITSDRNSGALRMMIDELMAWQALMIDREERMRALKLEVDELRERLGMPTHYSEGSEP
jgi:PAS domain S-box-containing protein